MDPRNVGQGLASGGAAVALVLAVVLAVVVPAGAHPASSSPGWLQEPAAVHGDLVVPSQSALELVDAADPQRRRTLVDGPARLLDVARDGRTVLVASRGIEVVDLDTGARWQVREEAAGSAVWSPDERRVAVGAGEVVEILDVAGGVPRQLLQAEQITVPGWCGARTADSVTVVGWSHDAAVVLVVGHDRGCDEYDHSALVAVDVATGELVPLSGRNVTSVDAVDLHPTEDRVAFAATINESGPPVDVVVMGVRGQDRQVVDRGLFPRWSSDGTHLAYGKYGTTQVAVSDLQTAPVLVGEPFGFTPHVAAWSPDGRHLLITPWHADNAFLMDLATGAQRHLLAAEGYASTRWAWTGHDVAAVRSAGDDRIATAAAVARRWFPTPQRHAVVARADDFADALAAGSVVAVDGGPVLLTGSTALAAETADALADLAVEAVTIMGGAAAVSEQVADDLRALGLDVRRIGGSDRAQTAARASDLLPGSPTALLASGTAFPDALALGPLAVAAGAPILLTADGALPSATEAVLAQRQPDRLLVAGGPAVIPDHVVELAEAACSCPAARLAGSDRTATAVAVAEELERVTGQVVAGAFLVAGDRFPDALAAAAAAGRAGRPLLLTADRGTLTRVTADHLAARASTIRRIDVIGDGTVIADVVVQAALAAASP